MYFIFISPKDVSYLTRQPILSVRTLVHAEFSIRIHFFQPFHFHPLKILIFPDSVHIMADSEAKKLDQSKKRNKFVNGKKSNCHTSVADAITLNSAKTSLAMTLTSLSMSTHVTDTASSGTIL